MKRIDRRNLIRLKVFVLIGFMGLFVTGGVLIWAGVSAVGFVKSQASQIASAPLPQLPKVDVISCWSKAQNLMSVEPWLIRPVLANLEGLKTACLEEGRATGKDFI